MCTRDIRVSPTTTRRATSTRSRSCARSCATCTGSEGPAVDLVPPEEPVVDPSDLYGLIPEDYRQSFDAREVIARIVDGSWFHEFKELTARRSSAGSRGSTASRSGSSRTTASCSRSRPRRARTSSSSHASASAARVPGTSPASWSGPSTRRAESRVTGQAVMAVACAEVPKSTVVIGGSFGAGNYGMAGPRDSPRALDVANARISVMGGEQAATVLTMVGDAIRPRSGQYEHEGNPSTRPRGCGTTGSSTRSTRGACWRSDLVGAERADSETKFGIFRM